MGTKESQNWLLRVGSFVMKQHPILIVTTLVGFGGSSARAADETPSPKDGGNSVAFQQQAAKAALQYTIRIESDPVRELSLKKESILRWSNPVGGKETHGDVFLWTDRGRPEVILSLYEFVGAGNVVRQQHEFCSLSLTKLSAMAEAKTLWSPEEPGLRMKSVPGAEKPADSTRNRLREMRTFAERFTSDKTTREGETRPLRLLTQPIYRYDGTHPDILDAGLFAYVEATDPEVLLLIEARLSNGQYEWTYGFTRLNSISLRAFMKEQLVWEAPLLEWRDALDRSEKPYTVFRIR
jgi:hypothetical protein